MTPGTVAAARSGQPVTYHLYVRLRRRTSIEPGRLGRCRLERGWYVYTGSARRNMAARLRRHLEGGGRRHWHIDWLLAAPEAEVAHVVLDRRPECTANAALDGAVVIPGFGASDCRDGCGSHLLRLGARRPRAVPRCPAHRRTHCVAGECAASRAPT